MPIYLPETTTSTAESLTPRQIVAELDKYVVGQPKAKRAVAIALRNRMRRQKLPAEHRRRDRAEEHPDDRADRRRQDRDRAAPRAAGAVAVHQGRGVEVHRGRLRRPRRRVDGPRPGGDRGQDGARRARGRGAREGAAGGRRARARSAAAAAAPAAADYDRPRPRRCRRAASPRARSCASSCATGGSITSRSRSTCARRAFPSFEIIAGSSVEEVDINVKDMLPGLFQGRTRKRRVPVPEALDALAGRRAEAHRHGQRGARGGRSRRAGRHHLRRRDRQDRRARGRAGAGRQPRGRPARHPADRRRHDGQHEVRHGEDRSHPVHRRRRVPRLEAVGSHPGAAGPVPDPRRARAARPRRVRAHPHRAEERAHQAVHGAALDRRA